MGIRNLSPIFGPLFCVCVCVEKKKKWGRVGKGLDYPTKDLGRKPIKRTNDDYEMQAESLGNNILHKQTHKRAKRRSSFQGEMSLNFPLSLSRLPIERVLC
jgi:hypothetical protein